ncbi:MAG: glycolate oxidase subunit GlcE [Hyphomicrobiales bacterium]
MAKPLTPASEAALAEIISSAESPLRLEGLGTKAALGHRVQGQVLSLAQFSGIAIYEPEELILEAGAATPLSEIEKLVAGKGQMLAFEPPDFSKLLGSKHAGSIGGITASNLSGPRRLKAGAARDHVLGVRCVSGRGEVLRTGARVVKNVTGYDLPKLLTGSWGTLAAMTSVTLKVLPRPETEETLVLRGLSDADAVRLMSEALQSPADVSAAAHLPGEATYLRLDGIAPSIAFRRDRLVKLLDHDAGVLAEKESRKLWQRVRDAEPFHKLKDKAIWRLSVTPMDAPAIVALISTQMNATWFYDWAGGLVWLATENAGDAGAAIIRGALPSGHATLLRAGDSVKQAAGVFQPQAPALAALTDRIRQAFDPRGILNPGIMG